MNKCVYNMSIAPWPKVEPQKPNPGLVRELFRSYAGAHGELTAITGYFYNSLMTGAAGPNDLSDLFACVSKMEMVHLEKLGHLIVQFGGDPRLLSYGNGRPAWWSAGVVPYGGDAAAMLRRAVRSERQACEEYRRLMERMEGAPRALIERIRQDEEQHLELFQRTLGELERQTAR